MKYIFYFFSSFPNIQKEIGYFGLNVLKELREFHNEKKINLKIIGSRPTREEIKMGPGGELDALNPKDIKADIYILQLAFEKDGFIISKDKYKEYHSFIYIIKLEFKYSLFTKVEENEWKRRI
jgi:predicted PilT family ATPase